jgi:hypothetical protein
MYWLHGTANLGFQPFFTYALKLGHTAPKDVGRPDPHESISRVLSYTFSLLQSRTVENRSWPYYACKDRNSSTWRQEV